MSAKKIRPFLWFNDNLEEAIHYYTTIFKNVKVGNISRIPGGKAMSATFEIEGQEFMGLNGGPHYSFTPAISFFVDCEDQAEVDYYWNKLTADGGKPSRCGWLVDRFGLSWQIIPKVLGQLMSDKDPAKAQAVVQAMLKMDKIVVKELQDASK